MSAKKENSKIRSKTENWIEEIDLPEMSTEQRIAVAILCSLELYREEGYVKWAENWLSGRDRSRQAAIEAAWAASLFAKELVSLLAAKAAATAAQAAETAGFETAVRAAEKVKDSKMFERIMVSSAIREEERAIMLKSAEIIELAARKGVGDILEKISEVMNNFEFQY